MKKAKKDFKQKIKLWTQITISLGLILAGVSLIFVSNNKYFHFPKVVNTKVEQKENKILPSKIYIPKIEKSLNVAEGKYENERWEISDSGVSYLTSSSLPGEKGNSVFYGHNRKDLLGNLYLAKKDDPIYVLLDNGTIVKYKIVETRQIKPSEVDILQKTENNRLTVYTCSGFLDQARFVVLAEEVYKS